MLEIKDLTFSYTLKNGSEKREVLKGLNFSIAKGEIVGILGPNGSGKTTLFKILSTLLPIDSGTVKISNVSLTLNPNEIRRSIGVIFQVPSLDKKLSVLENLIHQGHLYGMRGEKLKEKIQTELKRYGLLDRANEAVESLSGGLQRRVEILKGMLHSPSFLLMDEPSSSLDPRARKELWEHLKQLKKEGMTILLTTHLIEEAERCDRLVLLNEGTIVSMGSPKSMKEEIGGEVIVIETEEPQSLASKIKERFPYSMTILANTVRMEVNKGHALVPQLIETFGNEIGSITVGKPTLEDIFIHKTGHKL